MSKLKIRGSSTELWETIDTQRSKVRKNPPWTWVAHRGYYEGSVENTIAALIRAKEKGFQYCEIDVRFTSDNVAILCHNPTIAGTNEAGESVTLTIADCTAEEVTSIILRTVPRFGKIHPPTLDKVLDTARIIGIGVCLDIKEYSVEGQVKSVARSVLAFGMQGRTYYYPVSTEAAGWITEIDNRASIEFSAIPSDFTGLLAIKEKCEYVGVGTNATSFPTAEAISGLRENGIAVSFWNVSESNFTSCMDSRPHLLTLADNTNIDSGWDEAYLETVNLW